MPSLYNFVLLSAPQGPLLDINGKTGIMTVKGKPVDWISPAEVAILGNQLEGERNSAAALKQQLTEGAFRMQHTTTMATLLGQVVECDGDISNELMLNIVEVLKQYSNLPRKEQIN